MVNENLVEIIAIVDRSGSMTSIKNDAENGFNSFIKEQKENVIGKKVKLTIAQFDNEYEIVYNGLDIKKFKKYTLVPRGSTALYDAIGNTVDVVGNRLSDTKEKDRPGKIIVVVVTDGEENSSKEYSFERVKEMINHQKNKYSWEFIFMCTNDLTAKEAVSLGFSSDCVAVYSSQTLGTKGYTGMSADICRGINTNSITKLKHNITNSSNSSE